MENIKRFATIGTQTESVMWPMTSNPQKHASDFIKSFPSEGNFEYLPQNDSIGNESCPEIF